MLESGSRLQGRYVVEGILGQGGMGSVFLARNEALGNKRVAIKEMQVNIQHGTLREQSVRQFQQEARILGQLSHPGLVSVTDFFAEGDNQYLVMSYIEGETLEQVLHSSVPTVQQVLEWADQICDVLDYLHSQDPPVLFRDLKPGNIMRNSLGRLVLIDFGIARVLDTQSATSTFLRGAGTGGFAPLEQYHGNTDVRTDIYAFGATLYNLLVGDIPPSSVERASGEEKLLAPSNFNASVPAALDAVILRMMEPRREDRYRTVSEVRQALRAAVRGPARTSAPTLVPLRGAADTKSTARRHRLPRVAALVLCLLALAGMSFASYHRTAPAMAPSTVTAVASTQAAALGTMTVSTNLARVDVLVDGSLVGSGLSKGEVVHVPQGRHTVEVRCQGYASLIRTVEVGSQPVALEGTLTSQMAALKVTSKPSGARVLVDGRDVGTTPVTVPSLLTGYHSVRLEKDGYTIEETRVLLSASKTEKCDCALQPMSGKLIVDAGRDDLTVAVDGQSLGSGTQFDVSLGKHQVTVTGDGLAPYKETVTVRADHPCYLRPALQAAAASLTVDCPQGQASVKVNGSWMGRTPLQMPKMAAGTYHVHLEREGYKCADRTVSLAAGASEELSVDLEEKPVASYSKPQRYFDDRQQKNDYSSPPSDYSSKRQEPQWPQQPSDYASRPQQTDNSGSYKTPTPWQTNTQTPSSQNQNRNSGPYSTSNWNGTWPNHSTYSGPTRQPYPTRP